MTDDIVASSSQRLSLARDLPDERGEEMTRFLPVWNGVLHEFRNHLTVLLASATELREAIPPVLALDLAGAVTDAERNVQSLSALLAQLDAAVNSGEMVICDLDEVIERALRIAGPSLGRGVSVAVNMGRKTGVRNRGAALECLLAALLVDLARAAEPSPGEARRPQLSLHVDVGRSVLALEIESNGARPSLDSWRFALASELGTRLDATIGPHPEVAGYLVQLC